MSVLVNFSAPSGKWPQKITALAQTLRMMLATALAFSVDLYVAPGDSDVSAGIGHVVLDHLMAGLDAELADPSQGWRRGRRDP